MNPFAKAATILEERGWTRFPPMLNNSPTCIGLALSWFGGDEEYSLLSHYIYERYGTAVTVANDNPRYIKDKAEAVNILRECARRWETR